MGKKQWEVEMPSKYPHSAKLMARIFYSAYLKKKSWILHVTVFLLVIQQSVTLAFQSTCTCFLKKEGLTIEFVKCYEDVHLCGTARRGKGVL